MGQAETADGSRPPDAALRAVLVTLAPAVLAPVLLPAAMEGAVHPLAPGLAAAILLCVGGWALRASWGRIAATTGLVGAYAAWCSAHFERPQLGFLLLLANLSVLAGLWPRPRPGSTWASVAPVPAAAAVALVHVLGAWTQPPGGPGGMAAVAASASVAGMIALGSASDLRDRQVAQVATLLPCAFLALRAAGVVGQAWVGVLALGPALLVARALPPEQVWRPAARLAFDLVGSSPPRMLVASFAAWCAVGTLVLAAPIADARGEGIALVDALFTATSAVCVTGLVVLDTPNDLTRFGHVVVFVLFQVGGLGIMTFAAAGVLAAGRRLGVRQEALAAQMLGARGRGELGAAVRRVLLFTGITEGVSAALLVPAFLAHGDSLPGAAWRALFTSVSAFCNAGFALQTDSLVPYQRDPWILLVVATTIVVGSFGPIVTLALPDLARGRRVSLFVRLSVTTVAVLLVVPFVLLLGLEWSNALGHLPWPHKLTNAWFAAVTPRTAGFNSIDVAALSPGGWMVTLMLMLVGGGTGSTAGGLKVTTVAVLAVIVLTELGGRRYPEVGFRTLPSRTVQEAIALAGVYLAAVALALFVLQLTQQMALEVALFEAVSALGTVGLSIGGTAQLDDVGKVVIAVCMFAGRVGPLTLFLVLSEREQEQTGPRWPQEEVPVG